MKTKIIFLSTMLFIGLSINLFAQAQKTTDISERLTTYMPIFQSPHCSTYLSQFGDSEKTVYKNAETIGLNFFSTGKPPGGEGTYFHIFADPQNLSNNDDIEISDYVIYTFIFTPDKKYLSFSATIVFKSPTIARAFQSSMLEKVGVFEFTNNFSNTIQCKRDPQKNRLVTLKLDGNTLTFVVIDYNLLLEMTKKNGTRG